MQIICDENWNVCDVSKWNRKFVIWIGFCFREIDECWEKCHFRLVASQLSSLIWINTKYIISNLQNILLILVTGFILLVFPFVVHKSLYRLIFIHLFFDFMLVFSPVALLCYELHISQIPNRMQKKHSFRICLNVVWKLQFILKINSICCCWLCVRNWILNSISSYFGVNLLSFNLIRYIYC